MIIFPCFMLPFLIFSLKFLADLNLNKNIILRAPIVTSFFSSMHLMIQNEGGDAAYSSKSDNKYISGFQSSCHSNPDGCDKREMLWAMK